MAVHTVGHIRLDLDPVGMNLPREAKELSFIVQKPKGEKNA